MSDLVGNPEDRVSRVEVHIKYVRVPKSMQVIINHTMAMTFNFIEIIVGKLGRHSITKYLVSDCYATSWENKQCGFRTGLTQTSLYKHRKELEA